MIFIFNKLLQILRKREKYFKFSKKVNIKIVILFLGLEKIVNSKNKFRSIILHTILCSCFTVMLYSISQNPKYRIPDQSLPTNFRADVDCNIHWYVQICLYFYT